ncbi:MAG: tRNA lysidine(34) synthetase TilS [Lachnospiraceae bacterium]|jgi:tRNA(Ile)-lysidine synthase|nr:tRNA lysidine(34) synthetase TilS [Lachnospiraceae bacterium]
MDPGAGFEKTIYRFCEEHALFSHGEAVVVGVSGGADSVCLALLLSRLSGRWGLRLVAVHVNHCLRGAQSDGDAAFVEALCATLHMPCHVVRAEVASLGAKWGVSEEEAGRMVRYCAFGDAAAALGATKIAVAHHGDDSAETVLHHLARGTGLSGLGGIAPKGGLPVGASPGYEASPGYWASMNVSPQGNQYAAKPPEVVRPLLCVRRADVVRYLKEYGQDWREDATNASGKYLRNRIRHQVIPLLTSAVNARAVENILHLSHTAGAADAYLRGEAARVMGGAISVRYAPGEAGVPNGNGELSPVNKPTGARIHGGAPDVIRRHDLSIDGAWHRMAAGGGDVAEAVGAPVALLGAQPGILREYCLGYLLEEAGRQIGTCKTDGDAPKGLSELGVDGHVIGDCIDRGDGRKDASGPGGGGHSTSERIASGGKVPKGSSALAGLGYVHIRKLSEMVAGPEGRKLSLPGGMTAYVGGGILWVGDANEAPQGRISLVFEKFPYKKEREIPKNLYTKWFDYDKIIGGLQLRTRKEGDYIQIRGGGRKSVKSYLIDEKIPAPARGGIPLLADGSHVLWILGHRISEGYKITDDTAMVLQVRLQVTDPPGRLGPAPAAHRQAGEQ